MILFLHSLRIYLKTFDKLFKTTKPQCIFFLPESVFSPWNLPCESTVPIYMRMLVVTSCLLCVQLCFYSEPGLANPSFYSDKVTCLLKGSYQSIIVGNLEAYVPTSCFVFLLLKKSLGYWLCQVNGQMLITTVTFWRGCFLALSWNLVIYVHFVSGWWCEPCLYHPHCLWNDSVYRHGLSWVILNQQAHGSKFRFPDVVAGTWVL